MNYSKLFNTYLPRYKCGNDPVTGPVIGGANLITGIFGAESQEDINRENIKNQREENEKSRQFNHDEAELARQWQADQWNHQFSKQSAEWYNQQRALASQNYNQFLLEAEYNKPVNQVKRLAEAGFNPSAALSQGGTGMVSAATGNIQNVGSMSVPSGGSLSGAQASSSAANMPQQVNPLSGASIVGSLMKDLAEAYNKSAITRPTVDDINAGVRLKVTQAAGQELVNTFQGLQNFVLEKTKNTKVQQALQDLSNSAADTFLKLAQGSEVNSKTLLNKADLAIKSIEKELKGMDLVEAKFRISNMETLFKSQINLYKAQTASASATAANQSAQATTENQIREFKVNNAQIIRDISRLEWRQEYNKTNISNATVNAQQVALIKEFTEKAAREEIITASMVVQLQDAIQRKDWYMVDQVLTHAENLINAGANVGRAANTKPVKRK